MVKLNFTLQENEIIQEEREANYYKMDKILGIPFLNKLSGKVYITNFRVIFYGEWDETISIDILKIKEINKSGIGLCFGPIMIPICPIELDVIKKKNEQHKIALQFKRDEYLDLIEERIKN
ncbi:hypothetical protein H3N56_11465 [Cetobacterium sp. 2A]|uniref:GRAM domain-containing protein n=1 Tax=Cetobacterium sp. 2A TaxID=2754723 RepID=UPI00163CB505|nr:GRAM domain-containing protein [Cetobacterium sp. 2A]MBC2857050.1 hypothetical protein [Cetobacterium sp. 2A]